MQMILGSVITVGIRWGYALERGGTKVTRSKTEYIYIHVYMNERETVITLNNTEAARSRDSEGK